MVGHRPFIHRDSEGLAGIALSGVWGGADVVRKETRLLLPIALALAMAGAVAYKSSVLSEQAKAGPTIHVAEGMLSPDEKKSCRAVIQQALVLGWEDSHHDLGKALVIGRERLPEAQRAYEKSCEAAVEGVQ